MSNASGRYKFRLVTPYEFELVFTMSAKHRVMNMLFVKAKEKLARSKGISVNKSSMEGVSSFPIAPNFYKLVGTFLGKNVKHASREVKADGIEIVKWEVTNGHFERVGDDWNIVITINGDCIDKR